MQRPNPIVLAKSAVLALAQIKAANEAFDQGETNAHDTLEAIAEAVAAFQATRDLHREAA